MATVRSGHGGGICESTNQKHSDKSALQCAYLCYYYLALSTILDLPMGTFRPLSRNLVLLNPSDRSICTPPRTALYTWGRQTTTWSHLASGAWRRARANKFLSIPLILRGVDMHT